MQNNRIDDLSALHATECSKIDQMLHDHKSSTAGAVVACVLCFPREMPAPFRLYLRSCCRCHVAPFIESSTTHRRPAPGLAAPQSPLVALAMVLNLNHLHFDRTSTIPQGEGQQKDQWEKVTCVYQHPTHIRSLSRPSQARCIVIISPSNRSYA